MNEKVKSKVVYPLEIVKDFVSLKAPTDLLLEISRTIYKGEKIKLKQRTQLVLCDDHAIQGLNARYRGFDKPTDVLSFFFGDPDLLGEIYISLERAKIQARQFKTTYKNEILRLFIHGLLHLAGYEHETDSQEAKMKSKEEKYLKLFS